MIRAAILILPLLAACPSTDSEIPYSTDPSDRCAFIGSTIVDAGFEDGAGVTCSDSHATIITNSYPDHALMTGIERTNLQIPVPSVDYGMPIPLAPTQADELTTIDNALAVAVNGIPIYDYSSQGTIAPGEYDASVDTNLNGELDICGGHAGRGDDYHYHVAPTCMIEAMDNAGDAAILGWAFDGYPIYGNSNPDGTTIASGTLDICNGQPDETFGYRYHTSDAPPYVIECLTGEVDVSLLEPVHPLEGTGGGRPLGSLPNGGDPVTDLVHTKVDGGGASMTFSQSGTDMSIAYTPTGTSGCYEFTVTTQNGPAVGTYCR